MSGSTSYSIGSIRFAAIPLSDLFELFLPDVPINEPERGVDLNLPIAIHVTPMPTTHFLALVAKQSGYNIALVENKIRVQISTETAVCEINS